MQSSSENLIDFVLNDEDDWIVDEVFDTVSSKDEKDTPKRGSKRGKRANIDRDFQFFHQKIWNDYFSETPKYPEKYFRRRFRMTKSLFLRIMDDVTQHDPYFRQKPDA